MTIQELESEIRTRPYPICYLCSSLGEPLYQTLQDCLFGASGEWNLKKCPNRECGLVWLDPMPIEEDIYKAYQTYHTHQNSLATSPTSASWFRQLGQFVKKGYLAGRYNYYENSIPKYQKNLGSLIYLLYSRKLYLDFSVMRISAFPKGRLLDVGCGNGEFIFTMRNLGWQVQGVEIDEKAVNVAQKQLGLDVISGTLSDARFPDDYFDVVTLNHVIEHVFDPINLLTECRRVLKPGGKVVLTTPNLDSLGHKIFKQSWRGLEVPRHLMIFSLPALEACARKAHLDTVLIESTARWGRNIYLASKSIQAGRGNFVENKRVLRWEGLGFQILEDIMRTVFRKCGEEVYFVGVKSLK